MTHFAVNYKNANGLNERVRCFIHPAGYSQFHLTVPDRDAGHKQAANYRLRRRARRPAVVRVSSCGLLTRDSCPLR